MSQLQVTSFKSNSNTIKAPRQKQYQPSFNGYQDFLTGMSKDIPTSDNEMRAKIGATLPDLFKNLSSEDASQIKDLIDQGNNDKEKGLDGFTNFILKLIQGKPKTEWISIINSLANGLNVIKNSCPLGEMIENKEDNTVKIISYDNNEGKASEITLKLEDHKNIICGPETSVADFKKMVLGNEPKLVIGPVGWTAPDTDVLYDNNPTFKTIIDKFTDSLAKQIEEKRGTKIDKATDLEYQKLLKKGKKDIAGQFYQAAFEQFWGPIDKALFGKNDPYVPRNKLAFVTSSSYSGIDKAAMDYAKKFNLTVANITPYTYAEWTDTDGNCPYPLKVTSTVEDYAKDYNEFADILLVTGGRDHAYGKDFKNSMINSLCNTVIPVDIMKEVFAFEIPAVYQGKVANAAALLISRGMDAKNLDISQNVIPSTELTDTQNAVVTAIRTKLKQMTLVDPEKLASKLVG